MSTLTDPPDLDVSPTAATALLWDLDNVAPRRMHLASLAGALCALLGPDAARVVAAHRRTYRSFRTLLTGLGMQVLSGGRRPNGADRVLLAEARLLHQHGVRQFLVASNDHRFARIATFADLHVLTLTDDYLSDRLRAAARTVTVLRRNEDQWQAETVLGRGNQPGNLDEQPCPQPSKLTGAAALAMPGISNA